MEGPPYWGVAVPVVGDDGPFEGRCLCDEEHLTERRRLGKEECWGEGGRLREESCLDEQCRLEEDGRLEEGDSDSDKSRESEGFLVPMAPYSAWEGRRVWRVLANMGKRTLAVQRLCGMSREGNNSRKTGEQSRQCQWRRAVNILCYGEISMLSVRWRSQKRFGPRHSSEGAHCLFDVERKQLA